jgi:hypothetical protein
MKVILAMLVHVVIAAVFALGVVLSVKGDFWLLGIATLAYVVGITKTSLLHH